MSNLRLLWLVLACSAGVSVAQLCNVYVETSPTARNKYVYNENQTISVNCHGMTSFADIVTNLAHRFERHNRVKLVINSSYLDDLPLRKFIELNMTIVNLQLPYNNLSDLTPDAFSGLTEVRYFSLADNPIPYMPIQVFDMMPNIGTLDMGRTLIRNIPENSFKNLKHLETLVIPANLIHRIDTDALPPTVTKLHLSRNSIKDLNGSIRNLTHLNWLFFGSNGLTSLDGQFPDGCNISFLSGANNMIRKLPTEFRGFRNLNELDFRDNLLQGLDGMLGKCRSLKRIQLRGNQINTLTPDDFAECESLRILELDDNHITTLNGSLAQVYNLEKLQLSYNQIEKFSWLEVKNLKRLVQLDLSYNRIRELHNPIQINSVDWEINLRTLWLDNNEIYSLNGFVSPLRNLLRLNISHNRISHISSDDLLGLDQLSMLDISHNRLTTLEETSKTFMPRLEELIASYNLIEKLDKDLHGLPVLCWANLSNNKIKIVTTELGKKTQCRIRDGKHEFTYGVLNIDLSDNPILCDPPNLETLKLIEGNHTKIIQSAKCEPKPVHHINPLIYNTVPIDNNYPQKFQLPITAVDDDGQLNNAVKRGAANTNATLNIEEENTNVDKDSHKRQIEELASELEQLRTKVMELTSENKRLEENLKSILPEAVLEPENQSSKNDIVILQPDEGAHDVPDEVYQSNHKVLVYGSTTLTPFED